MTEQQLKKLVTEVVSSLGNQDMTLDLALCLTKKVKAKATEMGVKAVVAVSNRAARPVLVECMDDSYIASYDVALQKAFTVVSLKMSTSTLKPLAQPGGPLYGIQFTNDCHIVIFGGGEPLLYGRFLQEFRQICGQDWHLCAETSLNVPREQVELVAGCIDHFYVDCKDTNPDIYRRYTGRNNEKMLENLRFLLSLVGPERITVRLPLIPDYNTEEDRQHSKALLLETGIQKFDLFTYRVN